MAFITADFVKETSTTTGTGNIALLGARSPAQTFASAVANGDTFHYAISHQTANEWEVGLGTMLTSSTFSRAPTASSNGGSLVSFSAGTKSVDLVLPAARIAQLVGPLQIGATTLGRGTLSFANGNGVSWGLATDSVGGTVTASVAAAGGAAATVRLQQVADVTNLTSYTATSLVLSGSVYLPLLPSASDSLFGLHNVSFKASSDSLFAGAYVNVSAAGFFGAAQQIAFNNSNGVSFGLSQTTFGNAPGVRVTASVGATRELGIVSHVGGNVVSSVSRLAFSNASNVTFSLSTAANAATLLASVAASGFVANVFHLDSTGGTVSSNTSVSQLGFIDRDGIVWSMFTGGGAGIANMRPHVRLGLSAGGATNALSGISFSDGSGVSFGLAGNVITASVAPPGAANITVSAANGSFSATALTFTSHNIAGRVNFGTSAGNFIAATANIAFSAGTLFQHVAQVGFADANGVSFTYAGTQISASIGRELALVSHSGGNSVGTVRSLVFRDANNVSWSVSTAASGATVEASVLANPTPLAVSAAGASASAGTVVWSNSNNVSFGQNGSTITASASFAPTATREIGIVSHIGGNVVSSVSQLAFSNASNVTFSLSTAANAATVIASVNAGGGGGITYSGFNPFRGEESVVTSLSNASWIISPLGDVPSFQFDRVVWAGSFLNTSNSTNSNTLRFMFGIYTRTGSSLSLLQSSLTTIAFTGSGTVGNYSLNSGFRLFSMGFTSTLSASDYWIGAAISKSTAGNNAYTVSIGMLTQAFSIAPNMFGVANNATAQRILGQGAFSATSSVAPASIAFSQITGSGALPWRSPSIHFASGSA